MDKYFMKTIKEQFGVTDQFYKFATEQRFNTVVGAERWIDEWGYGHEYQVVRVVVTEEVSNVT